MQSSESGSSQSSWVMKYFWKMYGSHAVMLNSGSKANLALRCFGVSMILCNHRLASLLLTGVIRTTAIVTILRGTSYEIEPLNKVR